MLGLQKFRIVIRPGFFKNQKCTHSSLKRKMAIRAGGLDPKKVGKTITLHTLHNNKSLVAFKMSMSA